MRAGSRSSPRDKGHNYKRKWQAVGIGNSTEQNTTVAGADKQGPVGMSRIVLEPSMAAAGAVKWDMAEAAVRRLCRAASVMQIWVQAPAAGSRAESLIASKADLRCSCYPGRWNPVEPLQRSLTS